eukprot:RCo024728
MAVEFENLLACVMFIVAVRFVGHLFGMIGLSPMVGELLVGIATNGFFVYFAGSSLDEYFKIYREAFALMGALGVTLIMFQSGLNIHFDVLPKVGPRAAVVAVIGVILPTVAGMLFMLALGFPIFPHGLAMGLTLQNTSDAVAIKLLTEAKQLTSAFGQLIVCAAFVDDVIGIVSLVVLVKIIKEGSVSVTAVISPLLQCLAFAAVGIALSLQFWPKLMSVLFDMNAAHNQRTPKPKITIQPGTLHMGIMLGMLALLCVLGNFVGLYLLGAFVAGLMFSRVPRSRSIFERRLQTLTNFFLMMFFAATVGGAVPVKQLFDPWAFLKGLVCAVLPTALTKIIAGLFAGYGHRLLVSCAMVARGEFSFLVAQIAYEAKPPMFSEDGYAIAVWALLWTIMIVPTLFKVLLRRAQRGRVPTNVHRFRLKLKSAMRLGLLHEVMEVLRRMGLQPLDTSVEEDGFVTLQNLTVTTNSAKDDLDEDKFNQIRIGLFEVLDDNFGVVLIEPIHGKYSPSGTGAPDDTADEEENAVAMDAMPDPRTPQQGEAEGETQSPELEMGSKLAGLQNAELGRNTWSQAAMGVSMGGTPLMRYVMVKFMGKHHRQVLSEVFSVMMLLKLEVLKMYVHPSHGIDQFQLYAQDKQEANPTPFRLSHIRDRLRAELTVCGIGGHPFVSTLRAERLPPIFAPLPGNEHPRNELYRIETISARSTQTMWQMQQVLYSQYLDVVSQATDTDNQSDMEHTILWALPTRLKPRVEELAQLIISVYRAVSAEATLTVSRDEDSTTVTCGAPRAADDGVAVATALGGPSEPRAADPDVLNRLQTDVQKILQQLHLPSSSAAHPHAPGSLSGSPISSPHPAPAKTPSTPGSATPTPPMVPARPPPMAPPSMTESFISIRGIRNPPSSIDTPTGGAPIALVPRVGLAESFRGGPPRNLGTSLTASTAGGAEIMAAIQAISAMRRRESTSDVH